MTLVDTFPRYDQQFVARWYDTALSPYDLIWKSLPPPDQFVQNPAPAVKVKQESRETRSSKRDRTTAAKCLKTGEVSSHKVPADYISGSHLFEAIVPLPHGKPAITTMMARLKRGICFPLIPDSTGTLDYICFHSAFPPPRNCCTTAKCKNLFVSPPKTRLHVDPSIEPFKLKPEAYWQPIVTFLLLPEVAELFKPSATLLALTPSTSWA
jgi:hypothetical protein